MSHGLLWCGASLLIKLINATHNAIVLTRVIQKRKRYETKKEKVDYLLFLYLTDLIIYHKERIG
jgi:hypothetical protein